jgi:two-component system response regulator FixJ
MLPERPVYIIDDEPEMCRSLSLLLSTDGVPARSFGCGELFLDALDQLPPGILICDVMMPGISGIEVTRTVVDFIEKPFEASTILSAIASARCWPPLHQTDVLAEELPFRERQVLELVVSGLTSKEIARELDISPRTVETYRTKLLKKTGASSTAQLIRIGLQAGAGRLSFTDLGVSNPDE